MSHYHPSTEVSRPGHRTIASIDESLIADISETSTPARPMMAGVRTASSHTSTFRVGGSAVDDELYENVVLQPRATVGAVGVGESVGRISEEDKDTHVSAQDSSLPQSSRKGNGFIHRWFHSGSSDQVTSHHGSMSPKSEESLTDHTPYASDDSVSKPTNRSNHSHLLNRLFHANDDYPVDAEHEHSVSHGRGKNESLLSSRRHALLQKLFHHSTGDEHRDASPVSGSTLKTKSLRPNSTEPSDAESAGSSHSSLAGETGAKRFALADRASSERLSRGKSAVSTQSSAPLPASQEGEHKRSHYFRSLLMPLKNKALVASSHDSGTVGTENILEEKYGQAERVLGKGAGGTVRLFHKLGFSGPGDKLYAVKEFRKRRRNESQRDYIKKLTSEFCISSNLHHINVIETLDLVQDENNRWCEIMEYCPGGDLYNILRSRQMKTTEINGFFRQLVNGVSYLHSMGVAHRDLKPENLLLDADGILKITDFGVSDVFRTCWEKEPHRSKGLCGSEPYIAPEEFLAEPYDARKVDVWSAGIIYYAMIFRGVPWKCATRRNANYAYYLEHSDRFEPFMRLPENLGSLMGRLLDPDPAMRISVDEVFEDPYFKTITVHCNGLDEQGRMQSHSSHERPEPHQQVGAMEVETNGEGSPTTKTPQETENAS